MAWPIAFASGHAMSKFATGAPCAAAALNSNNKAARTRIGVLPLWKDALQPRLPSRRRKRGNYLVGVHRATSTRAKSAQAEPAYRDSASAVTAPFPRAT